MVRLARSQGEEESDMKQNRYLFQLTYLNGVEADREIVAESLPAAWIKLAYLGDSLQKVILLEADNLPEPTPPFSWILK